MKKVLSQRLAGKTVAALVLMIAGLFATNTILAQFTATWALTANKTGVKAGVQQANINIGPMVPGAMFVANGGHNTDGFKCQLVSTAGDWPTDTTVGYNIDFPISPAPNNDAILNSFAFSAKKSNSSGESVFALAYQVDGKGSWIMFGTSQQTLAGTTPISFNGLNTALLNEHTYVVRLYIYGDNTPPKNNRTVYVKNAVFTGVTTSPPAVSPTVTTDSVVTASITQYAANVAASVTSGTGIIAYIQRGVCLKSGATPTVTDTKVVDATNGTSYTVSFTGLASGINYTVRAYAITPLDTIYGKAIIFNALPPTLPVLATPVINPTSPTKANTTSSITDSGAANITEKGICWKAGATPFTSDFTYINGASATSPYTSFLTGLTPSTTYHVRAYAKNSVGTGYSSDVVFTTAPPIASITATPLNIDFGNVVINTISGEKSFTVAASALTPASDSIHVSVPAGYEISTTSGGGFGPSVAFKYSGGALPATLVYIRFRPTVFGTQNFTVTLSGGGATVVGIDNLNVTGTSVQSPDVASNQGVDFWTGYGYLQEMSDVSGNRTSMSVYVAAGDQDAVVQVDIPGVPSFAPQIVSVPAHTVQEITGFPQGDGKNNAAHLPDSRLYYTGITGRAVHIQSTNGVPVSAWTYTAAKDNTAAGCMNFPTNTWNSAYTVQAFGGFSNQPLPNSFFFVIAKSNNTQITITPTADIADSSTATIFKDNNAGSVKYPKNIPFNITLDSGQVFNAMSVLTGTGKGIGAGNAFSGDLSGTTVKTSCDKKIAVFGGNGRCLVDTSTTYPQTTDPSNNSGSDNMMQQMFPTVAWGKEYLTVPTKTMEFNYFRIYVQDPKTVVKVNGTALDPATLVNNLYYQMSGNQYYDISGSKAINVAQFIVEGAISADVNAGGAPAIGNNGKGDPEMIVLSPIQQAISNVTVLSPRFKNGASGGNYINVIIKKEGVKSFKIFSDINKVNLADTAGATLRTSFGLKYKMFNDTSIILVDTGASSYTPGAAYLSADSLTTIDSAFKPYPGNSNYYFAKFQVDAGSQYTLTSNSQFNAISYGMDKGESYGFNAGTNLNNLTTVASVSLKNTYGPPQSSAGSAGISTCAGLPLNLSAAVTFRADSLRWSFNGNANISPNTPVLQKNPVPDSVRKVGNDSIYYYTIKNVNNQPAVYQFAAAGSYPVLLTAFSSDLLALGTDPCTAASDSVAFPPFSVNVLSSVIKPDFTTIIRNCIDTVVKFTDKSTDVSGHSIVGWKWDFGFNSKIDSVKNPSFTYTNTGTYKVTLRAIDDIGCYVDTPKLVTIVGPLDTAVVKLDSVSFNFMRFKWAPVPGAVSYQVSVDGGTPITQTGTTYSIPGISTNPSRSIIVKAIGLLGCEISTGTGTGNYPKSGVLVPNAFTPGPNGKNRYFKIYTNYVKNYDMKVFSQWGEMVYHSNVVGDIGWDGTFKGKDQPMGVYIYVVQTVAQDGTPSTKTGSVNLIR
ncbi:gliding motility-associated C-terminal domain-containing protein [Parasediminibacterium sp. JCM 36343]|uniref:T9SS type B sorting domain-containing protein n=1 Tax=Parasediminibacterium sp. JCM 36343 TaxID=3374279 RepID=UPI00397DBDFA